MITPIDPTPIAITGIGVISAIGNGRAAFTDALLAGADGIRPLQTIDTNGFRTHHGGEIVPFDPHQYGMEGAWEGDSCSLMATCAALEALADAGLTLDHIAADPYRTAVAIAVLSGGVDAFERYTVARLRGQHADPRLTLNTPGRIVQHTARYLGACGALVLPSTACAASINAAIAGAELLLTHEADMVIAGGADPITRTTYVGFNALQAVAKGTCKPFDQARDGIAIGAGSVIFTLERLEDAQRRGAHVYACIAGYGLSNDAHHITAPHPSGRGLIAAMHAALAAARLHPADIGYIAAHGTGTPHNDAAELAAIAAVFGDAAPRIPISSVKSALGHTMGTAGAMNILAGIIALTEGMIPPTLHLHTAIDDYTKWNLIGGSARPADVQHSMANAVAFGGHTASIILSRV